MATADPGSFRDPSSRVLIGPDRATRLLSARAVEAWEKVAATDFIANATQTGRVISSSEVAHTSDGTAFITHPLIPFISYPYEWTFHMLKDAALLQLGLLSDALDDDVTIKDATPYNIQFVDGRPTFIDIGSFEPYRSGEPWIGYRQFTRQFLFPLMMRAWANISFQPFLRSNLEGPTASQMVSLLPADKRLRPSVAMHVGLQAKMEERMRGESVRDDLKSAGFGKDLILANVSKLTKLVSSLEWEGADTWSDYTECAHVERDRSSKTDFLKQALANHHPRRVADLGANDGHFSKIAAQGGATVVAIDGDEPILDRLYRSGTEVSPVVADLTNPSPSQGWAGSERSSLHDRLRPDLVIAYGLIHHLIYSASIPPRLVVEWLSSFGCPVVVEYVSENDEMAQRLTANKKSHELHEGRSRTEFEQIARTSGFTVSQTEEIAGGDRVLYELIPA